MENKITQNVLAQIKSGQVRKHSRAYFAVRAACSIFFVTLTALVAWFLFSLILFILLRHGAFYLPLFGLIGLRILFFSFPWVVFGLGVILFILLDKLLGNYAVAYRRPSLYTALALLGSLVLGIGLVHATGLNNRLHDFVKAENLPGLNRLYEFSEDRLSRSLLFGKVEEVDSDGFILNTGEGMHEVLQTSPATKFTNGSALEKGETVIVGAEKNGDKYKAYGVHKVTRPLMKAIINRKVQKAK